MVIWIADNLFAILSEYWTSKSRLVRCFCNSGVRYTDPSVEVKVQPLNENSKIKKVADPFRLVSWKLFSFFMTYIF